LKLLLLISELAQPRLRLTLTLGIRREPSLPLTLEAAELVQLGELLAPHGTDPVRLRGPLFSLELELALQGLDLPDEKAVEHGDIVKVFVPIDEIRERP
jgi:hypothetical protein